MIFDKSAQPLLEQYRSACEEDVRSVRTLLAALAAGTEDVEPLVTRMEQTRARVMDIWDQLQAHALGK